METEATAAPEYSAEIRFGVVMYGGVSLAIYINGVTNELFEMACATPRFGVTLDRDKEPCTREIFRRVSWLVGSPELRQQYAQCIAQAASAAKERAQAGESGAEPADAWASVDTSNCTQTRLVVDVIAGTSAGGINGVFLAKALANGPQFGALKDLWVNEGDIGLLLNDQRSYRSMVPKLADRSAKPNSLLNSDRMYAKLLYAMEAMKPLKVTAWPNKRGSPLVEEIDLFVTTTDIEGAAVPLRLFDKVVYERRYKQSYRFSYPNGVTQPSGNDFDAVNSPFLAFAARCTSSFPFAFEPMTLPQSLALRPTAALSTGHCAARCAGSDSHLPALRAMGSNPGRWFGARAPARPILSAYVNSAAHPGYPPALRAMGSNPGRWFGARAPARPILSAYVNSAAHPGYPPTFRKS